MKLCELCMVKDGMGRSEKSFLLNHHHLAFLQRIKRKKNAIYVLSVRMGLHRSIHVACRKTINILTLEVGEGYL